VDDGQSGLLVPPGDPQKLASALERLLTDVAVRTQFATSGPESVRRKEMTSRQMVEKHAELYARLVSSP